MSQTRNLEHIFRHQYGKIVASLIRKFGSQHLQSVEDAVQHSLAKAVVFWPKDGEPDQPAAWLYRVAYHHLISEFRKHKRTELWDHHLEELVRDENTAPITTPLKGEMVDSLLTALFVACDERLPSESQLVFTLKSLLGFSTAEVAQRLYISEANAYKRYGRAKSFFRENLTFLDDLENSEIEARIAGVRQIIYTLFTEGYLSNHPDDALRRELCSEAVRLTELLLDSRFGGQPETFALQALMTLHLSRMPARIDSIGDLILLENQDRNLWDRELMMKGLDYLARSASGDEISRYHIEAGIAAEHSLAVTFEQTRWDRIVSSYELLETVSPTAFVQLNKVVAICYWQGPKEALKAFEEIELPALIEQSYHWYAVKADLLEKLGRKAEAEIVAQKAVNKAPSRDIKRALLNRFESLDLIDQE